MIKKLSPFDFLNSINGGIKSEDLFQSERGPQPDGAALDSIEKQYVPFMINRGLSYFKDTVLYANEMNKHYRISSKMQYDFLRISIRAQKRFSKWLKKESDSDVQVVMKAYGYSMSKAEATLKLLTDDQLEYLKKYIDHGGLSKR
jgi:hypothetical protein